VAAGHPTPSSKAGSGMMPAAPDNGLNRVIFPVLFTASDTNRGIRTDERTGWQLTELANPSIICTIFMPIALPATTLSVHFGLAELCAVLRTP